MEVEFLLYSDLQNTPLKTFFKKRFQWPYRPQPGTLVPLMTKHGKEKFAPGVISHVEVRDGCAYAKIGTEESTEDLRDGFIPDGWQEISVPTE